MKPQCDKVLQAIYETPWAITPAMLTTVIGVASRAIENDGTYPTGPKPESRLDGVIAVIPITGVIFPHADSFGAISGGTSIETISRNFDAALNDPAVMGIAFEIDSPGGQVVGIHDFARRVFAARSVKPITAHIMGTGASAAYWIASAADKVFASATATVGSIGVVTAWTDDTKARKERGLEDIEIVSSQSPKKRMNRNSDDGRRAIQEKLDALADIFIGEVSAFRNTSADRVENDFGQGDLLIAGNAKSAGMIDAVGDISAAIDWIANRDVSRSEGGFYMDPIKGVAATEKPLVITREMIEAGAPDLLAALLAEGEAIGAKKERERIAAIMDLDALGHNEIARKAMFEEPLSADALAGAILRAEKKTREKAATALQKDAAEGEVAKVPAAHAPQHASDEEAKLLEVVKGTAEGLANIRRAK